MVDVGLPVGEGLPGETVHQVNADVAEARLAQNIDGLMHLSGTVAAVQEAQTSLVEGLGTHRHAVDAELQQRCSIAGTDVVGVALYRNLTGGLSACKPCLVQGGKELRQVSRGQLAGGAAAKVDGSEGLCQFLDPHFHLPAECVNVPLASVEGCRRVERAVDATRPAEGYMYVKTGHIRGEFTNKV